MTVAAVLVAYAACLGTLGSRMLGRARWTARAPLLAIVTYLAAGWSVIAALGLAGLTLAVHATALGGGLSHLIGACVHRLRATYGTPGGATVAGLGLTLAGAVAARTALTAMTHFRAAGRQALRHAQTARLVGQPEPALGAVLVEHAQPAAYCVAGRQPTVILTTGARAGARSRPAGGGPGARAGSPDRPSSPAASHGADRPRGAPVLAADAGRRSAGSAAGGTARRRRGHPGPRSSVARHRPGRPRHTPPVPRRPSPRRATDSVQRIRRLLGPGEPLGRVRRQLLRATAAALALTPVLLALTPAVVALGPGKASGRLAFASRRREQSPGRPRVARYEDPSPEWPARAARRARGPHDGRPGPTPPLAATPPQGPRERPARARISHRR